MATPTSRGNRSPRRAALLLDRAFTDAPDADTRLKRAVLDVLCATRFLFPLGTTPQPALDPHATAARLDLDAAVWHDGDFRRLFTPVETDLNGRLAADALPAIPQPLAPWCDRLFTLQGVNDKVEGDDDRHMRGIGCLLTSIELSPGNIQGGSATPAGWASGLSIDQEIKNHLQDRPETSTRFGPLEFGVLVPHRADAWFVGRGGERTGPFSADILRGMAAGGRLAPTDLVWREGMPAWAPATSVPGLFTPSRPTPAPSPSDNPYAAPGLDRTGFAPALHDAAALGLASRPYSFSAACALAIQTFKTQWVPLLRMSLIMLGISIGLASPQWIVTTIGAMSGDPAVESATMIVGTVFAYALNILVTAPLLSGMIVAGANAAVGRANVADVFLAFRRYGRVVLANLLVYLIMVGVFLSACVPLGLAVAFAQAVAGGPTETALGIASAGVSFVLMILGFAMVVARTGYAPAIVADPDLGRLGVIEAIRLNWSRTSVSNGFSLLGLLILMSILVTLSLLLFCVGYLLVGLPLMWAVTGSCHQLLFRGDGKATAAP